MGRSKMIFKDLEGCIKSTKKEVEEYDKRDKEGYKEVRQKLAALIRVGDYVDSCDWLVKEDAKEKIRFIRASKYNYKLVQQELGLTESAIKTFMRYCIARVKEKIGENTIDLIMQGEIQIALVQFETLRGTFALQTMFSPEVLNKLPLSDFKPEVLINCQEEIAFLYDYSQEEIQRRFDLLDKDKLSFLRYILEKNTPKFVEDKYNLVKLLTGNGGTKEEYFEKLELESTYRP